MTQIAQISASNALITNNLPVPSPLGSLDAYIGAVHRIPVLTVEDEQALARRFHEAEDLDAARELVHSHLRFVVHVARGYNGYGLPLGDLIQEGNIGLMKAVKRFDPDQGVRLVSFAVHWIRAEMHEFILKNWRIVKVATTKAQRKLFFNLRSMKQGFKDEADAETHRDTLTDAQIDVMARELNVKREEVIEMETRMSGGDVMLDPGPSDDGEESFGPIAYLADATHEPTAELESRERDAMASDGIAAALE
ncbi:MAG: RNA polymerase factor sigma-32, partial [Proteobacteria bacterium]|nr:RNA polymerase factor sigma-32 [Pseudomonadota bacterium]